MLRMKAEKRATSRDVAGAVGVSPGSVWNVINGRRPVRVDLRIRVLAAADKLGFHINSVAQTLRRRRSQVIGLCTTYVTTVYRSEEHTSELQSLMRISYAVFCLKKKKKRKYT